MLAKNNPLQQGLDDEMQKHQQVHANDICGLVAHTKDRSVNPSFQANYYDGHLTI